MAISTWVDCLYSWAVQKQPCLKSASTKCIQKFLTPCRRTPKTSCSSKHLYIMWLDVCYCQVLSINNQFCDHLLCYNSIICDLFTLSVCYLHVQLFVIFKNHTHVPRHNNLYCVLFTFTLC